MAVHARNDVSAVPRLNSMDTYRGKSGLGIIAVYRRRILWRRARIVTRGRVRCVVRRRPAIAWVAVIVVTLRISISSCERDVPAHSPLAEYQGGCDKQERQSSYVLKSEGALQHKNMRLTESNSDSHPCSCAQ